MPPKFRKTQVSQVTRSLSRLLRPQSIAVIGGGAWCRAVIGQLAKSGFTGDVWPVHPTADEIGGFSVYSGLNALPYAADAVFVGINREATIGAVAELARMGAGGAVCFAAGFAEVEDGVELNMQLLAAAGDMPILGPNCYGFINMLDGALLWPDQHGCLSVDRGVAILTQSSNIAINLTMQARALPIAYVITCGNQAQTTQAQIAFDLLDDPRVTAIGLHIEGFGHLTDWQALARKARTKGIALVALKVGRSVEAQAATVSHSASLAGGDAGAQALLDRLGMARVNDLPSFLETLKLLHVTGRLPSARIATISCSGGEASLSADTAVGRGISFPPLNDRQRADLFAALGPKVTLANPIDYHTYIWRDTAAMTDTFCAMIDPDLALTLLIVDFPRADRCDPADWECTIQAALATRARTGANIAMVATLPELLPEPVAARLMAGGVVPLNGLVEAFTAIEAAQIRLVSDLALDLPEPGVPREAAALTEAVAKERLALFGVAVPQSRRAADPAAAERAAQSLHPPFVLKGEGFAHKSEAGAVVLNLPDAGAVGRAATAMQAAGYLVEEMIDGAVAELLVGVVRDPAHGFVLTLAAGGVLTELLADSVSLLLPASRDCIKQALTMLKCHRLLLGYRGKPAADMDSVLAAIMAVQAFAIAKAADLSELEINPLLCTPTRAVAVDALIRIAP
jgi:acyl-CoA synthetase (NDP forming)